LRGRSTDNDDVIQRRMALVDRELAAARIFDYAVINDDLDIAVDCVLEVIDGVRAGRGDEIATTHGLSVVLAHWTESQEA
jgi:guanylate kinase